MRISLVHIVLIKAGAIVLALTGAPLTWPLILFFGSDLWVLYHLFMPCASGLVRTFTHFQTDQPEVWFTIDDGPDEHDTPRLLDVLDRHNARATFFLIGERAAKHPALVAEIARRGHEIAHHTHSHPARTFWCASPARLSRELDDSLAAFAALEIRPRRFRAPVGIKNLFLAKSLAERALVCVGWNVRSHDSFSRDPEKIVARVLSQAHPGSILLMHEGPSLHSAVRVTAISRVLEELSARGLRCVIPTDAQLR